MRSKVLKYYAQVVLWSPAHDGARPLLTYFLDRSRIDSLVCRVDFTSSVIVWVKKSSLQTRLPCAAKTDCVCFPNVFILFSPEFLSLHKFQNLRKPQQLPSSPSKCSKEIYVYMHLSLIPLFRDIRAGNFKWPIDYDIQAPLGPVQTSNFCRVECNCLRCWALFLEKLIKVLYIKLNHCCLLVLSKRADVLKSSFQRFLSRWTKRAIAFDAAKVRRLNWALHVSILFF